MVVMLFMATSYLFCNLSSFGGVEPTKQITMKLENILIIFAVILLITAIIGLAENSILLFGIPMAALYVLWLIDLRMRRKN